MATYTGIYKNLGVKLIVNQTSQNIANNSSVVSWSVYAYKSGTHHNPFNGYSQTPFKVTIDGVVVYNQNVNYDLQGRMEQLIASGTRTITHATDGTRSVSAQANADYTSTGYGYGAVVASGNLPLTTIPRISVPTLSTSSFNFGESVTLTTNRSSTAFTHSIFYVIGTTEHSLATNVGASTNITIPNSTMSSYPNSTSVTMSIRTKTYNGATLLGYRDTEVTVNIPASIIPTIGTLTPTETVAAANIFSSNDTQYIRGLSKLKATAGTVAGNSGSTISRYYFRIVGPDGVVSGTEVNTTSSTYTYETFNFPNKSQASVVYTVQCRVLDSRNRYSAWRDSSAIRVHYYEAPTINLSDVARTGSGNTSVSGKRTYNVQSIKEGGTTERNTGTFAVRFREKGASSWSTAGGGVTGLTLSNSEAVLATGAAANKFYEFQASVTDKIQTVYSSIVSVGSEFVTMEVLRGTSVGIGTAPTTGGRNLYVGTGGIHSYGHITAEGYLNSISSGHTLTMGAQNSLYNHFSTTAPAHYFNKKVHVAGDVFAGSNYMRKLAYQDEINSSYGSSLLTTTAQVDDMVTPGVYQYSGTVLSYIGAYGLIIARVAGGVGVHNGTNTWLYQTAYATNGNIYERRRINNAGWTGWTRMPLMSDIPTVPAAYAPTSGGSGDNRWIRFPSGHQICWGSTTTTNSTSAVTFPRAFTATPMISVSGHHASHSPSTTLSAASASAATFYIVDGRNGGLWGGSYTSGMTATLRYIAVGIG